MLLRGTKTTLLMAALITASPALADERHMHDRAASDSGWNGGGRHRDRLRSIPQPGQLGRLNNVAGDKIIVVIQAPNAPSGYLGGTYAIADGYAGFSTRKTRATDAKAKIIDVASGRNGCAHEAGVCVIRP